MSTKNHSTASTSTDKQPLHDITNTHLAVTVKSTTSSPAPESPVAKPDTPVAKQVAFSEQDSESALPYDRERHKAIAFSCWQNSVQSVESLNRRRRQHNVSPELQQRYDALFEIEYERERRYFGEVRRLDMPAYDYDIRALQTAWETYASSLKSMQETIQVGWQQFHKTFLDLTRRREEENVKKE
jgi:hypothetical protein